jgi:16S rRNA (cytidine1402-2'-O)-methyltransferase
VKGEEGVSEGALILVGTPIGNLGDLTPRAVEALRDADVIAAEDTRRTRALLSHAGVRAGRRLRAVHGRNERRLAAVIVEEVRKGSRVVYATDAGMPGISDPGERLVRACLDAGLAVEVVPGPSALLAGLVLSGLPTQRFTFEGFLPRKGKARDERLAAIAAETRTVVLFESPVRVEATLADLAAACGPEREVAVARELTKRFEEVWRGTLGQATSGSAASGARGEYVVVVGPAPTIATDVDDEGLDEAVDAALESGLSTRDAAAQVAAELAVPKRRAYDAATRLARARRG